MTQGDSFELVTSSGEALGAALLTNEKARNPIFVSIGSGLTLSSAIHLVNTYSCHRFTFLNTVISAILN
jgi:deoxyinosine 3'endonuclease (endonuclease V)